MQGGAAETLSMVQPVLSWWGRANPCPPSLAVLFAPTSREAKAQQGLPQMKRGGVLEVPEETSLGPERGWLPSQLGSSETAS